MMLTLTNPPATFELLMETKHRHRHRRRVGSRLLMVRQKKNSDQHYNEHSNIIYGLITTVKPVNGKYSRPLYPILDESGVTVSSSMKTSRSTRTAHMSWHFYDCAASDVSAQSSLKLQYLFGKSRNRPYQTKTNSIKHSIRSNTLQKCGPITTQSAGSFVM